MEFFIQTAMTIVCSVLACSGFWAYLEKKDKKKDATEQLLKGIAHDRIMQSSEYYIERGYVTRDEYENLITYLYEPYQAFGGNGSATHMIEKVNKLPIHNGLVIKGENNEDQ